jgi:hypothetical protein
MPYFHALRTWLVAYGIGAPVLFATQPFFARILAKADTFVIFFSIIIPVYVYLSPFHRVSICILDSW